MPAGGTEGRRNGSSRWVRFPLASGAQTACRKLEAEVGAPQRGDRAVPPRRAASRDADATRYVGSCER